MLFKKAVAESNDRQGSLAYHLHRHLSGTEPARSHAKIHASDLTRDPFCPRRYALLDLTGIEPKGQAVSTADAVTWRLGRAYAAAVVSWAAELGMAVGDWQCVACAAFTRFSKRPDKCSGCKGTLFGYREIRVVSDDAGSDGGLDLLIALPGHKKLRIYEIKSLEKDRFKGLKAPLWEHRLRTRLYLRATAESVQPYAKKIDTETAAIFYVVKGGWGERRPDLIRAWGLRDGPFSPFKEFLVTRDDAETEPYMAKSRAVHQWRRGAGPMPDGICPHALCETAQGCEVRGPCFSGKFPAGVLKGKTE